MGLRGGCVLESKRSEIFLVDMNAFFISCESARNPSLKEHPSAVAGDPKNRTGIILAANYPARALGVKTAMNVYQAVKLCPQLILVPPDHAYYREKSQEMMALLNHFSPVIQQNSIDEAWLDMTGTEKIFGPPVQAAKKIQTAIQEQLNLPCSIGISENKFLAKMAADLKKPLGITTLYREEISKKLWPLPIGEMHGVGKKTQQLFNAQGLFTIGDLAKADTSLLIRLCGLHGEKLHQLARGIDRSKVEHHCHDDVKSIGNSTTLSKDLTDLEEGKRVLLQMAEKVGQRARAQNKKGRTVQITVKFNDFTTITRQTSSTPTYNTQTIYEIASDLFAALQRKKPIRLLGVTLSGFDREEALQLSFLDERTSSEKKEPESKRDTLDKTLDLIKNKYGNATVQRGSLISKNKEEHHEHSHRIKKKKNL
ncbi:MAG TPA: DNA polymerase IV [Eubacteriaceae bacterium]|nr:DNA polymerase IV [Eubacteriaceae bacterium]